MKCKPTEKQLKFMDWEFGVFFHFGIRSFNPGHFDWDGRFMPADTFNPDSLDCEQWISTVKAAGAKYAILTAKHHDGFANWPSKYTEYSVAATPWKNGNGDVVKDFTDACRKYGVAVGLYYSPAQWGNTAVKFDNPVEYDNYFINQISELLSNYGKIDYLWFDGCGSDGHVYDGKRIIGVIRSLQPDILIFGMWDPDTLWCENEDGYCNLPNRNEREYEVFDKKTTAFFPYECDCRIRASWFYDLNSETIKSVDELIGMYEMSVGHGANFLLNIGPDNHGRLCDADVHTLTMLKNEIDRRYKYPLNFEKLKQESDCIYSIEYSDETQELIGTDSNIPLVRSVIIEEDLSSGDSVTRFRLYSHSPGINPLRDTKFCIYTGETIGHKFICRFPAVRASKISLGIVEHDGEFKIKNMKAFE
jgi:alpha-L-fucosidase